MIISSCSAQRPSKREDLWWDLDKFFHSTTKYLKHQNDLELEAPSLCQIPLKTVADWLFVQPSGDGFFLQLSHAYVCVCEFAKALWLLPRASSLSSAPPPLPLVAIVHFDRYANRFVPGTSFLYNTHTHTHILQMHSSDRPIGFSSCDPCEWRKNLRICIPIRFCAKHPI